MSVPANSDGGNGGNGRDRSRDARPWWVWALCALMLLLGAMGVGVPRADGELYLLVRLYPAAMLLYALLMWLTWRARPLLFWLLAAMGLLTGGAILCLILL